MELSRFAHYLIPTDSLKVEKFKRRLNPKVKESLIAQKIKKFLDLKDRVVILKENL